MRTLVVMLVILAGCFSNATPGANKGQDEAVGEEQETFGVKAGDAKPAPFDGKKAMKYLEQLCAIGPRQSATPGMREQIKLVTKHFEDLGLKVEVQAFKAKQVTRANEVDMTNLIIRFHPERDRRVMLCSHYDTRPIADQEPNPQDWRKPFVSANDGGSGVAFLMELGNHMKALKLNVGVDFVLFDGEEFIFDRDRDEYFIGSRYFAQEYKKNKGKMKYGAAVLLDMVGGHGAKFPKERNSVDHAGAIVKQIWDIAAELKVTMFQNKLGAFPILDDHIELHKVGIPAVDIIDFDYPHWHRLTDVPANVSADSLTDVSKVLSVWLQRVQ